MVLVAAALHAGWNAVLKIQGDRLVVQALMVGCAGLIALPFLPFLPLPAPESWPYLAVTLVVHTGYQLFLVAAYRQGDLSYVYPIARGSAPLLVALVSVVFLGEILAPRELLGVLIIGLAIMSLAFTRRANPAGTAPLGDRRSVLFALGTGLFIAAYTLVDGLGARASGSPHAYILWYFALDLLVLPPLVLALRRRAAFDLTRRYWRQGLAGGAMSLAAYWLVVWAMTLAPLASVAALRETSMIFAIAFGVIVLREPLSLWRLAASFLSLVGVLLVKTAR